MLAGLSVPSRHQVTRLPETNDETKFHGGLQRLQPILVKIYYKRSITYLLPRNNYLTAVSLLHVFTKTVVIWDISDVECWICNWRAVIKKLYFDCFPLISVSNSTFVSPEIIVLSCVKIYSRISDTNLHMWTRLRWFCTLQFVIVICFLRCGINRT